MRSLDSEHVAPENPLAKFENTLVKKVQDLKESRDDLSGKELKIFIRFFCKKNAATLGLNEEQSMQIAEYFFKYTYENPETVAKTWELLHELSEHSTDPEAANRIFEKLIKNNHAGTTLLWRVIRGIVRGDLEVKVVAVGDQNIYHLATPEDSAERQKDKNRHNVSNSLKARIENDIVPKPLPDTGIDSVRMTPQDKALFFKILHFMQSDIDALIASTEWQNAIGLYFKGITQHLLSTINILDVQGAKSDKRKKRYRNFIMHVLDGYLKELIEYCKSMTWKHSEKNPFAADLLFEHYLLSNNLLVNGVKEPSHKIIEEKWKKLFEEMRTYIEDNATMWGMQAYDPTNDTPEIQTAANIAPPDHFAPQVTDELPPPPPPPPIPSVKRIRKASSDSLNETIIGLAAITEKPAAAPKTSDPLGTTVAIAAEIARFSKTPQELPHVKRPQRVRSSISFPCLTVAPGSLAEENLIDKMKNEIDDIFAEHAKNIKSGNLDNNFVDKLTRIAKNEISTPALMDEFISRILLQYEDLSTKLSSNEANITSDNISAAFNAIGKGLSLPDEIMEDLGKRKAKEATDTNIPMSDSLKEIKGGIPSIDSVEFENLKAFLLRKGVYSQFQEIEKEVDSKGLHALIKLHERVSMASPPEYGFTSYYKEKEALVAETLKDLKKLTGNWFTKFFKFGRSAQVKDEMQKYAGQLESSINTSWNKALKPLLEQYGKIIFGSDLYVERP